MGKTNGKIASGTSFWWEGGATAMLYSSDSQPVVRVPLVVRGPPSGGTQRSLPKKKKKDTSGGKYLY